MALDIRYTSTEHGTPAWIDMQVPLTATRAAAGAPSFAQFLTNGSGSTGVFVDWFNKTTENSLYFVVQLPHGWVEESNIHPHVHWVPKTNGANNATVCWALEYTWANVGATFANTTIIHNNATMQTDVALVANKHYITDLGDINATGKHLSSQLICRVYRDAGGVLATDNYDDDAGLIEIDFHILVEGRGSVLEWSKS